MKKQLFLLLVSILFSLSLYAQNKWDGIGLEANISTGKILRHSKKFPTILPNSVQSYELNAVFQTYGKQDWHQRRRYPLLGFGMTLTDYGIDSIYGKCISIYPNLQIPLLSYKNFEWTIRAGFGLGFVTRPYERTPSFDTVNTAIGSKMNNYSIFATDIRYRIDQHWDVQLGGNFSHVSNAALRAPNLGINVYGVHAGVRYFPTNGQPDKIQRSLEPLKNRWLIQARLGLAAKEAATPDGPIYPVYLVTALVSKRYWSKNKVYAGIDYSYHSNMYAFLRTHEIKVGEEKANSWKSALVIGNEFLMGHVGITFQLGFYLKNYYIPEDFFYQKLGGSLYLIQKEEGLLKELSVNIFLKTHKTEAELVEVGIGAGF